MKKFIVVSALTAFFAVAALAEETPTTAPATEDHGAAVTAPADPSAAPKDAAHAKADKKHGKKVKGKKKSE